MIYPEENEWLFYKILNNGGCIITEYAPNIEAKKENFPKRNRIVSGLSNAILVVEAEYRSGTAITAKFAKKQGKTVYCLPSNIDSRCGIGTNRLIQEGAKLIIKPSELIEAVLENELVNVKNNVKNVSKQAKNNKNNKENKELSKKKKVLKEYELIYKTIEQGPIHINDICKILNQDISQVTPILTMLEIEEYIEQLPGNQFKIKENIRCI